MEAGKALLLLYSVGLVLLAPGIASAADEPNKIFTEVCGECHTAKKQPLDKIRMPRADWSDTIERMIGYGAVIPKDKMAELLDYLVRTQGPNAGDGKK